MPVVNTVNFVDRLRDITKRIDIRPSLQNVSRRCHGVYEALTIGSPTQVHEFYKYIKVYKQCPDNDLLFMNMTATLTRATLFPTKSMYKQVLKFENHLDKLILAEGHVGIFGFRGIAILASQNQSFLKNYRKYKRDSEVKKAEKEIRASRKNAKILAALKDARVKLQKPEPAPAPVVRTKPATQQYYSFIPRSPPPVVRSVNIVAEPVKVVECPMPETDPKVVEELSEIRKYCESLKVRMEEAEKKREENEVTEKLFALVQKLTAPEKKEGEGEEEEVEEDKSQSSSSEDVSNEEEDKDNENGDQVQESEDEEQEENEDVESKATDSEDEGLEKIEDVDVDAIEYEML